MKEEGRRKGKRKGVWNRKGGGKERGRACGREEKGRKPGKDGKNSKQEEAEERPPMERGRPSRAVSPSIGDRNLRFVHP